MFIIMSSKEDEQVGRVVVWIFHTIFYPRYMLLMLKASNGDFNFDLHLLNVYYLKKVVWKGFTQLWRFAI